MFPVFFSAYWLWTNKGSREHLTNSSYFCQADFNWMLQSDTKGLITALKRDTIQETAIMCLFVFHEAD